MKLSVTFRRRLNHILTYLYLIALSIIIIYPLLITVMSAFKSGNVVAFKLDGSTNFTFDNFLGLFNETLYGTWYLNTLIIATVTMIVQTSIVVLAGYAYSRYNFMARKQSLVFFLKEMTLSLLLPMLQIRSNVREQILLFMPQVRQVTFNLKPIL